MLQELDNYDWAEVFGEGSGGNCTPIIPNICKVEGDPVSGATFSREDVAEICQMQDGENDERDWIIYGRLKDGRWFAARGGCDYTGWDCHASNSGDVGPSKEAITIFGLTKEERERFGVECKAAPPAGKGL